MSLYAIGDLHLHFQSELKARNQIEDIEATQSNLNFKSHINH